MRLGIVPFNGWLNWEDAEFPRTEPKLPAFIGAVRRTPVDSDHVSMWSCGCDVASFSLVEQRFRKQLEDAGLQKAALKRRAQFVAARLLAQVALQRMGIKTGFLPIGEGGAPVWPPGVCGALTHTDGFVVCLLGPDHLALGIDAEKLLKGVSLDTVAARALTARERGMCSGLTHRNRAELATRIFSAKEALFKALFPRVGSRFGFDAAELARPIEGHQMILRLLSPLSEAYPVGMEFLLISQFEEAYVLSWVKAPLHYSAARL